MRVFVVVNASATEGGAHYDASLDDFGGVLPSVGDHLWYPKGRGRAVHVVGRYFTPAYLSAQGQASVALECEWDVREKMRVRGSVKDSKFLISD